METSAPTDLRPGDALLHCPQPPPTFWLPRMSGQIRLLRTQVPRGGSWVLRSRGIYNYIPICANQLICFQMTRWARIWASQWNDTERTRARHMSVSITGNTHVLWTVCQERLVVYRREPPSTHAPTRIFALISIRLWAKCNGMNMTPVWLLSPGLLWALDRRYPLSQGPCTLAPNGKCGICINTIAFNSVLNFQVGHT